MSLEFIIKNNDIFINSLNGDIIEWDCAYIEKFEKKNKIQFLETPIDNDFYKFDVKQEKDTIALIIYKGYYDNKTIWNCIYTASIIQGKKGVIEKGDCNLDFWHEYFATNYGTKPYDEANINKFCFIDNHMDVVRKVFCTNMQNNIFLFMKKYNTLKKINYKTFNKEIFNIAPIQINKNVGKIYNDKYINYAIQREIELEGEIFFDITVISGKVTNGTINIEKKHRYFMTEDYIYSPDNGPLDVFVSNNICGHIYDKKMKKKYPNLLLDKYKGKYYYQYFLSKEFIPAFEILAKAGLTKYADLVLDKYYEEEKALNYINIYGKNDKEIFGFKLNKLKNIKFDIKELGYQDSFSYFIMELQKINTTAPYLLDEKNITLPLFLFFVNNLQKKINKKDMDYVKKLNSYNIKIYIDYLNMCYLSNRYSGGLYPKKLLHEHDVMISYMNQLKEAKNNVIFERAVSNESYTKNIYEDDIYCILAPRKANDLVNESYALSHCVRSYIENVALGRTKIYFLRKVEQKSKSLVTIEVMGEKIYQVKGRYNRDATLEENEFIKKWAKERNLTCEFY